MPESQDPEGTLGIHMFMLTWVKPIEGSQLHERRCEHPIPADVL